MAILILLASAGELLAAPYALEGSSRGGPWGEALVADGAMLLAAGGTAVERLDPVTLQVIASHPLPETRPYPRALAVGDGEVLVGGFLAGEESGHGVVHVISAGTGAIRLTLSSPIPDRNDFFGSSVAVLGDRIVVGAPGEQRVYLFDAATGAVLRTFEDPSGAGQFESWFGGAVAAAGEQVWVAAPRVGEVHRFDPETGALGGTIALSPSFGDVALAGAGPDVLVGSPAAPGEVRRYDGATGMLLQNYGAAPPAPSFGPGALAADDAVVVVGDAGAGAVHVFDRATGAFLATVGNPTPGDDPYENEQFGRALAVVDGRIAVGDPYDQLPAGISGSIYLFDDVAGCGDEVVTGRERCDDGNLVSGDGCDANCRPSGCGNGMIAGDETCDDGNSMAGDGCDANCRRTGCGNGAVTAGEECDDGGRAAGDGCSPSCRVERCGNGILDPGETCDDANEEVGDGCDGCELEPHDAFACYGVRRSTGASARRLFVRGESGTHAVEIRGPIAVCLGDRLTAPLAELTCYRARTVRAARRRHVVQDTAGTATVEIGSWRTLCLPADGSRIVRRGETLRDPTPNAVSEGGFGYAAAVSGGRVVVSEPGGPSPFQGSQHRFAENGQHLGATVAPWASRVVGSDVTDAGRDEVVVASMDDDAYLMSVRTGAFLRRYVAAGSRTPDDRRQIVAAGPWVLHGDPGSHLGGSFAGAVYVFDRNAATLVRTLLAPQPLVFASFGRALAALGNDPLIGDDTGVHRYDPVSWVPTRTYPIVPGAPSSVAAAGDRVLIGTDLTADLPGRAALLAADSGAEVRSLGDPLQGAGDLFGGAVASAAGAFVVGASGAGWLLPRAGAVHVFDASSGERLHTILPPDLTAGGRFGHAVAAGGDVIVATRLEDGWYGRGEAYTFTRRLLDAYACRAVRRGGVVVTGADRLVADRFAAAPATLGRLTRVCRPVALGVDAPRDTRLLLTCYRSNARVAPPEDVVVRNALGTQTLTLAGRRAVCLPARDAAVP